MYRLSVPVFTRGLRVMATYLDHAAAKSVLDGSDPDDWVNARLAPTMLPLAGQVQRASDTSKNAVARLAAIEAPSFDDNETSMADLKRRLANTIAFFDGIKPIQLEAAEAREVPLSFSAFKTHLSGEDYLLQFALPNFFFHVTTAHDILRHRGVAIGKLDYLGPFA